MAAYTLTCDTTAIGFTERATTRVFGLVIAAKAIGFNTPYIFGVSAPAAVGTRLICRTAGGVYKVVMP